MYYNLFLLKSNQSPQFNSWWYSLAVAAHSYKVLVQIWNKVDQCDPLLCQAWQSLWCAHNRQSRSMSTALSSASSISSRIKKRAHMCFPPTHRPLPTAVSTRWLSQVSARCVFADNAKFSLCCWYSYISESDISRSQEFSVFLGGTATGTGKIWYRKKSSVISTGKIWYRHREYLVQEISNV